MKVSKFARRHRLAAAVSILLAAALVMTGCSSSKKSGGATTSAAAGSSSAGGGSTAPAPTGDPFKIGFICTCGTGLAAIDAIRIMTVWEKYTNDNGGINGHPVQLVTAVDPGNPGVALTKVKELVAQNIVALVSTDGTSDAAWISYMESTNIPILITPFGSPAATLSQHTFSTGVSEFYLRDEIILATKKAGASKLALLYCAEIAVCSAQVTGAKKAAAQYGGVDVVYDAAVLASAPNYTAQCLTAKSKGADAMFFAAGAATSLAVASNCATQGYTPHIVSDEGAYSLAFAGKPGLDGFIGTADNYPFYDFDGIPAMKTFKDAFTKYDASILTDPLYGVTTQLEWTMGLLITEAAVKNGVGKANPITPAALLDGIYAVDGTTLGGMTPPLHLTKGEQHENRCWFWTSIENGKWTTKYGTKSECADKHASTDGS
jgi:branched-chain amino acid transport system substrate-binding protein